MNLVAAEQGVDRARRRAEQAAAFDAIGPRYDEAFPHKEGQVAAVERLLAGSPAGARVLDAGCGTGVPSARQLVDAGCRVTGIDISPGMLELARRDVPEADLFQYDILDIDASMGPFDVVVAFFSILMLPRAEIPQSLRALRSVLAPTGRLLLSMVEADLDYTPISFIGTQTPVTGYLREDLREVVEGEGFAVEWQEAYPYAPDSGEAMPEVQLFLQCRVARG